MAPRAFTVLSLCSGIAGLELGLRMALQNVREVGYVENDVYSIAVLEAHISEKELDDAPVWTDLKTFKGKAFRGKVSCITAGFPCQPASCAGRRKGTGDERWLWPHIARIIREVRPEWIFMENVSGLLTVNAGGAFAEILRALAALRYDVAWEVVSAKECGAPHRRERVFILAHSNTGPDKSEKGEIRPGRQSPDQANGELEDPGSSGHGRRGDGEAPGSSRPLQAQGRHSELADPNLSGFRTGDPPEGEGCEPHAEGADLAHTQSEPQREQGDEEIRSRIKDACGRDDEPADADLGPSRAGMQSLEGQEGLGRHRPPDDREGLADAEHPGQRDGEIPQGGQSTAGDRGKGLAHGSEPGLEGRSGPAVNPHQIPPFPPGPGDYEGWKSVLELHPELAPAIESDVLRVADGLPGKLEPSVWQDRLRVLGNAVVPIQAATAFIRLYRRLEWHSRPR